MKSLYNFIIKPHGERYNNKKKIGENQAIIIINGLKKMFEIGSSPPINIERKAQIDNLLQTFMKRNSYNKVVKNPNKQNSIKRLLCIYTNILCGNLTFY